MMKQRVLITHQLATDLAKAISECEHDRIFVLTDDTTRMKCWPVIESFISMRGAHVISIAPGDIHKNVESLMFGESWSAAGPRVTHCLSTWEVAW